MNKTLLTILNNQVDLSGRMLELERKIGDMIDKKIQVHLGAKIHLIESTLKETILQKEILIEKGYMTRDEINKKYEELRNKNV